MLPGVAAMKLARLPVNIRIALHSLTHQQRQWVKGKFYEADLLDYTRQHYQGGTFIDGGACVGNHTLYWARFCADQVIAVEPVQSNMEYLMENLRLSDLEAKVTPIQAALGSKPGRGKMQHAGKMRGQYRLVSGNEIEVTTLDAIISLAHYPLTLIKLDIQGGEPAALEGGLTILEEQSPVVFVEAMQKSDVRAMDAVLGPLGYQRRRRFCASPTYEYVKSVK